MHRNIARAYDYLQREHDRVRAAHVKILAQKDRALERRFFQANLESAVLVGKHYPVTIETDKQGAAKKVAYTYKISGTREVKAN